MIKLLSSRCYPLLGNDHIYVCFLILTVQCISDALYQKFSPDFPTVTTKFHLSDDRSRTFSWGQVEISNSSRGRWIWLMIQWCFIASSFGNLEIPAWLVVQIQFVHAYTLDVLQALARTKRWTQTSQHPTSRPLDVQISWNLEMAHLSHFTTSQAAKLIENNPKGSIGFSSSASKRRRALLRRDSNSSCAWRLLSIRCGEKNPTVKAVSLKFVWNMKGVKTCHNQMNSVEIYRFHTEIGPPHRATTWTPDSSVSIW